MDKNHNTLLRTSNLRQIPQHLLSYIQNFEKQYGKYCYLPLDTPRIYDSKIVDWFFEHCRSITKLKPDVADTEYGYSLFNSVNVCLDGKYMVQNPIWSDNQYPNFDKEFPHFYQQMMDQLPLAKIPRFSFWNSTRPIAPHRDHSCLLDMPNSFRIMIYDENPVDTLYVYEDAENFTGNKTYIKRYTGTNSFVWNNLRVVHGSDYTPGYRKILLLINNFIPDYRRYLECIENSVLKYAVDTLVSSRSLQDFVVE